MKSRITVRMDEELTKLLNQIQYKGIFNLSGLIRESLRYRLRDLLSIDNSGTSKELEKDEE